MPASVLAQSGALTGLPADAATRLQAHPAGQRALARMAETAGLRWAGSTLEQRLDGDAPPGVAVALRGLSDVAEDLEDAVCGGVRALVAAHGGRWLPPTGRAGPTATGEREGLTWTVVLLEGETWLTVALPPDAPLGLRIATTAPAAPTRPRLTLPNPVFQGVVDVRARVTAGAAERFSAASTAVVPGRPGAFVDDGAVQIPLPWCPSEGGVAEALEDALALCRVLRPTRSPPASTAPPG